MKNILIVCVQSINWDQLLALKFLAAIMIVEVSILYRCIVNLTPFKCRSKMKTNLLLIILLIQAKCLTNQIEHGCHQCDATTVDEKKERMPSECNEFCIQDNRLDECKGIKQVDQIFDIF